MDGHFNSMKFSQTGTTLEHFMRAKISGLRVEGVTGFDNQLYDTGSSDDCDANVINAITFLI